MTSPEERRDRILAGARLRPGADVLDLSGWSALTFGAHELIGDGWVYTVAADVGLLEELLGAAHKLDAPGIAYLVGDVEALPLPDGSVDAIVGASVFAAGVAPDRAAGELRRVLRPAGRLSLCERVADGGESLAAALRDTGFAEVSVELGGDDEEAWATARTP